MRLVTSMTPSSRRFAGGQREGDVLAVAAEQPEPHRACAAASSWPRPASAAAPGRSVRSAVLSRASYLSWQTSSGVPACEYQVMNCWRSLPVASSKQVTKSSTVAACPSWRSK